MWFSSSIIYRHYWGKENLENADSAELP
ncbi:Protein CBG25387 [Caenorhabditis briggsae]|uniref:Protein CBG25387 n=1 Tax=Caenorhabditis briggsae TaxID=6238 RepID=B6IIQ1_CAEBR|nr:Protein CBG25387 [Caenorhabditis briggsae]CAR99781.1 Protein CBG25387 [Caenorhabditis briggsae]